MKKLYLTVLVAVLTTACFGQKTFILAHQDKKGFFAVSAGGSLPLGRFGSCSPLDNRAGMAATGLALNVSAGYRVVGRLGLMVRSEQHRNAVHMHGLLTDVYHNENEVWTARAGKWSVNTVMGGPYVSIPMGRFTLDTRLLAGRAQAVIPGTSLISNVGDVALSVSTTSSRSQATAYGGGVSLRYRLGRSIAVLVNGDYTQARFRFDNLTSEASNSNGHSERSTYSADRPVSVISASAGLAILFGNNHRPF